MSTGAFSKKAVVSIKAGDKHRWTDVDTDGVLTLDCLGASLSMLNAFSFGGIEKSNKFGIEC